MEELESPKSSLCVCSCYSFISPSGVLDLSSIVLFISIHDNFTDKKMKGRSNYGPMDMEALVL